MGNTVDTEVKEIQKHTPVKAVPKPVVVAKEIPDATQIDRELQQVDMKTKENPPEGNIGNCVIVKGKYIEIKPTKLKYHRNRTALFYRVIDNIPLPEILAAEQGVFDKDRDGDKCMMDWLISVFDDSKFVEKNYNELDSAIIYKCLEIFKRLNGIKDVEEKNLKAKETKA